MTIGQWIGIAFLVFVAVWLLIVGGDLALRFLRWLRDWIRSEGLREVIKVSVFFVCAAGLGALVLFGMCQPGPRRYIDF